ncbi:MAG: rhodanese-like domain-containing protein [Actinomycetota bacterium]|nr:rhodanese-like domain-containing protein [Actinomycetota bacterium]
MKKIFIILLLIAICVSISACNKGDNSSLTGTDSEVAAEDITEEEATDQSVPDMETATEAEDAATDQEQTMEKAGSSEILNDQEPAEVVRISVKEVYEDMQKEQPRYFLLDVRTQEEYDYGHLEGTYLIPVNELDQKLDELPRNKPIVVYCRSGNRSARAAEILVNNGFKQVYDMGGIIDWIAKDYPIVFN